MRKDYLHNALMNPENISDDQLMELRDTVARFPFFGAAQIALTQALKARSDIQFTDQLAQAGIYTGQRAMLYRRLKHTNSKSTSRPQSHERESFKESSLASQILDNEEFVALNNPIEAPEANEIAKEPAIIQESEVIISATEFDEIIDAEKGEETAPIKITDLDPLEAQLLVSAVNISIEMEVQPEREIDESEEAPSPDIEPDDENSYAAHIYRRAQRMQQSPGKQQEDATDSPADDDLPAFEATPLSHGIRRIRTSDNNRQQRDLIDKFIHSNPQIARGKSGDYPTGNLAKDSLEDDFSIVTETMAVLFAKQGKLDKARKAFRKLMEQHPEKSIYFAAQLKNLEHFKK
jgi:tetratricopeptide (TPR) repeat protein